MKIEKLVIYGFGKHVDVTIELGSGINVLYGKNESGKTTIQQFILHMLFGFPQRNGSLLRYEPRSGGKYGGQLHLQDTVYGKCIVERVDGKSAGDVTVYFEDGEVGGQETLDKLLRQYDRAAFESVFSFSLLQLQGFEKMTEQELSRTLLASGTTGVDHLIGIEATMQKELDDLFKQRGRNPELNKKLTELRQLEETLQEEVRKADQYAPAVERLQEIEEALRTTQETQASYESQLRTVTSQRQQLPLAQKKAMLQARLTELQAVYFPAEGIERYTSIKTKLAETQAAAKRIERDIERVDEQLLEETNPNLHLKMAQLIEGESVWHRSLSRLASLQITREQLIEHEQSVRARLGIRADREARSLKTVDVSIRQEEALYELLEQLQDYHRELDRIETKQRELERVRTQLKEQAGNFTPPSQEEIERVEKWPRIKERAAEAKAYVTMRKGEGNHTKTMVLLLLTLIAIMAVYGVIAQQYAIFFIAVISAAMSAIFMKRQTRDQTMEEMEARISSYAAEERQMEELVERVATYEKEQHMYEERQHHINIEMQQLTVDHRELEHDVYKEEQALQLFLAEYGIDGLPSATIIPELFRMIREVQEGMQQLEQVEKEAAELEGTIHAQHMECEQLLQQKIPREALYEWLRQKYNQLRDQTRQYELAQEKKEGLTQEAEEKAALMILFQQQIDDLFQEAAVTTEAAYYDVHVKQQEKARIVEQLNQLETQLTGQQTMDLSLTDAELKNMMEEIQENNKLARKAQDTLLEEKAILYNKTNALLSNEATSELQQRFEIERAEFIQLAKKWATKKALASAIEQLMNDLKEKKLPYVLTTATKLFTRLTNGRYESMVMTAEGYFEVISTEGMRFPIIELSQATKEQAYISLRLALALSIVDTAPFPIIMDDPFVHFDNERLAHIRHVLEGFTTHQFIYFTCHEDMQNEWQQATIITVSTIGNNEGANVV